MRSSLLFFVLIAQILLAMVPLQAQPLSIASFNVHYITPNHPFGMTWEGRRHAVMAALRELDADLIAFQEMETFVGGDFNLENRQLADVVQHFPRYGVGATGDPRVFPSTQPILFRKDRFQLQQQGFFFFSATPEVIYSPQWNGGWSYFSSWVKLRDRQTDLEFYVLNLHNDFRSRSNRIKSSELIRERIQPWLAKELPVVVLGDFNAPQWFKPVELLTDSGMKVAPSVGSTYHFNRGVNLLPAIDHILFAGFNQVGETRRLDRQFAGVWPSDHYPVQVVLNFSKRG